LFHVKHLRIVVVGTGTNIGKTHASVSILKALVALGVPATGLKPVESGVGLELSDTAQLAAASSRSPKLPPPYVFPDPLSPHLAARRAGVPIEVGRIVRWVRGHTESSLVIETAGALLSPLGRQRSNLTLAEALTPTALVLVAPDRLGALHEVASAVVALQALAPQLPCPIVLLQPPSAPDASTGTNADELQALGIVEQAWTLQQDADPGANAPVVLEALRAAGCFT
jgi:dethiobiotin synthetase